MDARDLNERLSRISTRWTVHQAAFRDGAAASHFELLQRYRGPAYRYLLSCVRNAEAAEDLAQEFALMFLRGDFGNADPARGRFRDYLRTSLSRLATDYFRKRKKEPGELAEDPVDQRTLEAADLAYDEHWRNELLSRAWQTLLQASKTEYAAVKLRAEEPELTSGEMADRLGPQFGKSMTPDAVRKAMERGRRRFVDALIDEVRATLADDDQASLEWELNHLGLIRYCKSALAIRKTHGA